MKKALRAIRNTIQILFIIIALAFIVLYLFGFRFYVVTTGSMHPTIPVGSICLVNRNVPYNDIVIGDIISFSIGENMLVTHRAIRIDADGITTKGDANHTEDAARVTEANYAGKTVWSAPKLGYAVTFLKSKTGVMIIVTIFILLMLPTFFSPDTKEKHHSS